MEKFEADDVRSEASVAEGVISSPLWYQSHVIPRPEAVQVMLRAVPKLTAVATPREVVMVGGTVEEQISSY